MATSESDVERRESRLDRRQDSLDARERELDTRHDGMELREAQLHEREADVARLTVRADRIEAELESQRAALADAEVAVDRERAVLQRRMAEIESRESAAREELDEAVRAATEDGGRRGLRLRGDGKDAGALEELHAALRNREAQLQAQERRLAEQQATLQRREADLELYARKLQQGAVHRSDAACSTRPSRRAADEAETSERWPSRCERRQSGSTSARAARSSSRR